MRDGKWHGLDQTIAALGLHGMLVVDDMTPMPDWPTSQQAAQEQVRRALLTEPQLIAIELASIESRPGISARPEAAVAQRDWRWMQPTRTLPPLCAFAARLQMSFE
ncbi:MAG TPA: hypothetical protein VF070_35020 [Streptosporangiaceae bacterium]